MTSSVSTKPPNFSWVVEGLLAALAYPSQEGHIKYLVECGIKFLVSLTPERKPPVHCFPELIYLPFNIPDFTPPSIRQVEDFLNIVDNAEKNNQAVAVHCMHGKGRTGTLIACYLAKMHGLTAQKAIVETRGLRPGSIETLSQEKLITEFVDHV